MKLTFGDLDGVSMGISRSGAEVRLRIDNPSNGIVTVMYLTQAEAKTVATALVEIAKGAAK